MLGALDTNISGPIVTRGTTITQVSPQLFTSRALGRGPDDTTGPGFFFAIAVVGGSRKLFSVLFRAQRSRKKIVLRHAWVAVQSSTIASIVTLDLVRLADKFLDFRTTSIHPLVFLTSDNPDILPDVSVAVPDPIYSVLSNISFTEGAVIGSTEFNLGITAAASAVNPPGYVVWRDLLNPAGIQGNFAGGGLTLPRNTNAGVAIIIDASIDTTLTMASAFDYTSEDIF